MPLKNSKSYDATVREVLSDPDARAGALENDLRHKIAQAIIKGGVEQKLFPRYYYAKAFGITQSQADRLLQREIGGELSLFSICRAAVALDLDVSISIKPKQSKKVKREVKITRVVRD